VHAHARAQALPPNSTEGTTHTMFVDALTQLCSDQAVTADAASENTFDGGNQTPKKRWGAGEPIGIALFIKAIGTTTGSAIVQAIMSAAENLGTPTVIGEIHLATADLAAGKTFFIPISPGHATAALRYLGAYFDITGTVDFTVDAFIVPQSMYAQIAESYAKGFTVS
jgi:hypothetical protein